jgi:hypothetical protein
MHVPQPEVPADESNPRGFGESQWLVDFHDRLLRRANVRVADARPQAWFDTGKLSTQERHRDEALEWLEGQFSDDVGEIVLKDPRLAWFIGLWRSAALRCGVEAGYAVMLRPPAEVVGSKQKYYSGQVSEVSRAASWLNHMLHTERATRTSRRAFIQYADLLDDWTIPLYRLGEQFELDAIQSASAKDLRRIHDLIDPGLHRVHTTWDDVDVPKSLRVLIDETWHQLNRLNTDGAEEAEVHVALDQVRREYVQLYSEAEAMTQSTTLAARRKKQPERVGDEPATASAPTPPEAADPAPPAPETALRRARGLLGRRR